MSDGIKKVLKKLKSVRRYHNAALKFVKHYKYHLKEDKLTKFGAAEYVFFYIVFLTCGVTTGILPTGLMMRASSLISVMATYSASISVPSSAPPVLSAVSCQQRTGRKDSPPPVVGGVMSLALSSYPKNNTERFVLHLPSQPNQTHPAPS